MRCGGLASSFALRKSVGTSSSSTSPSIFLQAFYVAAPRRRYRQYARLLPSVRFHTKHSRSFHLSASSQSSASGGPTALYHERVNAGDLRRDDHQLGIVQDLQRLYNGILSYRPPPVPEPLAALPPPSRRSGFLSNLFGNRDVTPPIPDIPEDVPRSLYLFGDVGCGKTMLMDLLYESLPNNLGKRRVHFHAVNSLHTFMCAGLWS